MGIGKAIGTFLGGPIPGYIGTGLELLGGAKSLNERNLSPKDQAYGSLMGAFKAADQAGLHRLSVAGSPAGYSPAPMSEAQGLMNAGAMLRDRPSKKENELVDAQIQEARSRTMLNQANTRRALAGPQPGLGQDNPLPGKNHDGAPNPNGDRGTRVEPFPDLPATQEVQLGPFKGVGPNPEAFEVGLSEFLTGVLLYGPQWAKQALDDFSRRSSSRKKGAPGYVPKPPGGRPGAQPNQPGYIRR